MAKYIESYSFGKIVIDGKTYTNDVIVFPESVESNWWRKEGHSLCSSDLEDVLEYDPDLLIIGRGASSTMRVPSKVKNYLDDRGIELKAFSTPEAVKRFNKKREEEKVAAGLHLTC